MQGRMRNGLISACRPKRNGNSLLVADFQGSLSFGVTSSDPKVSGWPIRIRDTFPTRTREATVLPAYPPSSNLHPMGTVCMTWLEMCGSGPLIGTDRITINNWLAAAEWHVIP